MNGNKNQKLSNLTLLFQSAITLSNHEGDLIWSRFSAFIVANTIIFTLIGVILETSSRNIPIWAISIIGFIVTFLWLLSTARGFEAIEYWNHSAREIEEEILGENAKINLFTKEIILRRIKL